MCSLSVKVLSNYLHLQAHCDKLKAFRIAQFFQNSKIQKITVKKIFFQNFDTGFLLIGVFRVYSRSFIAKLAKTKKSISSETNPSNGGQSVSLWLSLKQLPSRNVAFKLQGG